MEHTVGIGGKDADQRDLETPVLERHQQREHEQRHHREEGGELVRAEIGKARRHPLVVGEVIRLEEPERAVPVPVHRQDGEHHQPDDDRNLFPGVDRAQGDEVQDRHDREVLPLHEPLLAQARIGETQLEGSDPQADVGEGEHDHDHPVERRVALSPLAGTEHDRDQQNHHEDVDDVLAHREGLELVADDDPGNQRDQVVQTVLALVEQRHEQRQDARDVDRDRDVLGKSETEAHV